MSWEKKVINFLKGNDKKTIILVDVKEGLDKIVSFFNKSFCNMPVSSAVVFFGMEVPKKLIQANLEVRTSEDYLIKEDYERIDKYIFGGISKTWYLYKDITDYRGIHLGKIFEYDFQKYLTPRIKNLEILKKVIAKEKIEKIVVIEDSNELANVVESYTDFINISILMISLKRKEESFFNLKKIRDVLGGFLRDKLDRFCYKQLMKNHNERGFILIDAKLYRYFRREDNKISFIFCPLEGGAIGRFNLIKEKFLYLPVYFRKSRNYLKNWAVYQKKWKDLSLEEDFKSIFKYNGIPIWGIINRKIATFFLDSIPRIISNINMLDKVAGIKKIKIVILRNDVKELERTIIFALHLRKIPSLVIQHGILAESNGHNVLSADKFAAWGKASVEWYGKFGNSLDRFEITGNPRFDMFINWKPRLSKQLLCRKLNLDKNKGIVLFATQQINKFSSFWADDLFWVIADNLLSAMQQFPDKQLIIKVDPYEDLALYRERMIVRSRNDAVAVKDIDIYSLIYLSDLIITQDSTVGLEAMIFDKPLITVNLTKRQDRVPYAEKGAALGVYHVRDLASVIKTALFDQEIARLLNAGRKVFIEEFADKIDGKASERISNLIDSCIEIKN